MPDAQSTYNLLNEIFLILDDGDRRFFSQFDLTSPRFYALLHLGNMPGISLSELSNLMLCDKSNATRIIKGLEADGLVYRLPHESDGRAIRLYLTTQGREVRSQALASHRIYNQSRFDVLDEINQDNLLLYLTQLKTGLREKLLEAREPIQVD